MTCGSPSWPGSLAGAGAQVLLICSSWVPGEHKTEQWLALNAARAVEVSLETMDRVRDLFPMFRQRRL